MLHIQLERVIVAQMQSHFNLQATATRSQTNWKTFIRISFVDDHVNSLLCPKKVINKDWFEEFKPKLPEVVIILSAITKILGTTITINETNPTIQPS
jgi:hypothetical protein